MDSASSNTVDKVKCCHFSASLARVNCRNCRILLKSVENWSSRVVEGYVQQPEYPRTPGPPRGSTREKAKEPRSASWSQAKLWRPTSGASAMNWKVREAADPQNANRLLTRDPETAENIKQQPTVFC
jgi:hypothetical protein